MEVSYTRKGAIFRSWEDGDNNSLTVLNTEDGVQINHFDQCGFSGEVVALQLSAQESGEVAKRIYLVLSGMQPNNPINEPGAQLIVTRDTAGDPYREGVSMTLSNGDWHRDFRFCMTNDVARDLATFMHNAKG